MMSKDKGKIGWGDEGCLSPQNQILKSDTIIYFFCVFVIVDNLLHATFLKYHKIYIYRLRISSGVSSTHQCQSGSHFSPLNLILYKQFLLFAKDHPFSFKNRVSLSIKLSMEKLRVLYACAYILFIQSLIRGKLNMKIEQSEGGVIYTQNIGQEKIKSRRLLKEMFEKQSQFKFYGWDFCQNYTYITYLKYFKNIFESPQARKRAKVFTHISKLLNTRTSNQIKCHHQKMMNRHKSIAGIIEYLRLKIIKYLKHHSEAIGEIEKINRLCENFFIRESGFQHRVQESLQHKKNKVAKRPKKQVKQGQGMNVKQEDNMEHYQYRELKNSQFLDQKLKVEEAESHQAQH